MTPGQEFDTQVEDLDTDTTPEATTESSGAAEGTDTPAEGEEKPSPGTPDPAADAKTGEEEKNKGEVEENSTETPAKFTPNLKYRVIDYTTGQKKDFEINKAFAPLMKDADSEKMVRELHEKASGLDAIKPKLEAIREERNTFERENGEIKGSIDDLRKIYTGAVQSGNLLKLDQFFDKMRIPHEVVMQYAVAKAQLQEMDPAQRQMILSQIDAEKKAELAENDKAKYASQMERIAHQNRQIMLDTALAKVEVAPIAQAFDEARGTPGSFIRAVVEVGKLAWYESKGKIDLSPEQAIQEVIKKYGLSAQASTQAAPKPGATGTKAPVQRTTQTIPNVQGRSSSPLKNKPRSVEDIKELAKRAAAGEAV